MDAAHDRRPDATPLRLVPEPDPAPQSGVQKKPKAEAKKPKKARPTPIDRRENARLQEDPYPGQPKTPPRRAERTRGRIWARCIVYSEYRMESNGRWLFYRIVKPRRGIPKQVARRELTGEQLSADQHSVSPQRHVSPRRSRATGPAPARKLHPAGVAFSPEGLTFPRKNA